MAPDGEFKGSELIGYKFLAIFHVVLYFLAMTLVEFGWSHGLRTPNEGINQRYLKNWADVADKICFGRT